ncbi:MAG TPA: thioesterase family protein [Mycobacterium sp.]|nr:thioesterase family protein [Mycobacterium sp.]
MDTSAVSHFSGPYGLQGGLASALLLRRMRAVVAPDREPVTLGVRFIRPLGGTVDIEAEPVRSGALVSWVTASASTDGRIGMHAHAAFTAQRASDTPAVAAPMPGSIADWKDGPTVPLPPDFGPVAQLIEVRPAMYIIPYSGADAPVLCAWMRLKDDVAAADERLVILADSLAPSYSAILTELKAIPTVEMSVQLSAAAQRTPFEWVVVRSATTLADDRGWLRENIDVWSEDGTHLATATQLRIVR